MTKLANLNPGDVFSYFEEICAIPRGSGNMEMISKYCVDFAVRHSLRYVCDDAGNVVIYKDASCGYETSDAVILQGHLDMVCQKDVDCNIDFLSDGLDIYTDGDFVKARGTTLGADNGIAVAMIMAILADDSLRHPPIEAVFTADEEVGMIGASKLDMSCLGGKKMINIDSEDEDIITVSCAGGSEFAVTVPVSREEAEGETVIVTLSELQGGHSGVEIDKGRVNANILMARILNHVRKTTDFYIADICGGDKSNAIPVYAKAILVSREASRLSDELKKYAELIRGEISSREPGFGLETQICACDTVSVMSKETQNRLISVLLCSPNGIMEMSADIPNLVETSLNLGVLEGSEDKADICFALRSSKKTALQYLKDRLFLLCEALGCTGKSSGYYPPWEYNKNSVLRELYCKKLEAAIGKEPQIEAIHAGLECGVFADGIAGLDCISVGANMYDIHTTSERLSISSVSKVYEVIKEVLADLK